jgi:hypothetical protein
VVAGRTGISGKKGNLHEIFATGGGNYCWLYIRIMIITVVRMITWHRKIAAKMFLRGIFMTFHVLGGWDGCETNPGHPY